MQKYLKNDPKFVRVSNSSLKLLIFQLSNVNEVETIKYARNEINARNGTNVWALANIIFWLQNHSVRYNLKVRFGLELDWINQLLGVQN